MKKNQEMYGLKENYLINDRGRICTFKNGKIYCKGKLSKVENLNGIDYSFFYECGHPRQCEACKRLTKAMDKYFDNDLLAKLRKRDQKMM